MTNPIDLPASLLQSYSDIKQEELVFSQSTKETEKATESTDTVTSTGRTTRSTTRQQSKARPLTIAGAMSLDTIRETLFNARLNEAVKAQSLLKANEQALALKLDEAMQGSLRTKLQETPTYREAFTSNSLLHMWRIIKTTCMAGFTDEAILRFEAQFQKLKQLPSEDFHSYYLNFQTQLEFLQELLPGQKYDTKLLTAYLLKDSMMSPINGTEINYISITNLILMFVDHFLKHGKRLPPTSVICHRILQLSLLLLLLSHQTTAQHLLLMYYLLLRLPLNVIRMVKIVHVHHVAKHL